MAVPSPFDAPSFTPPTGPPMLEQPSLAGPAVTTVPPGLASPIAPPSHPEHSTGSNPADSNDPQPSGSPTSRHQAPGGSRTAKRLGAGLVVGGLMVGSGVIGGLIARGDNTTTTATGTSGVTVSQRTGGPSQIDVAAVANAVGPSVVTIAVDVGNEGNSVGTGVIVSADGQILTNNHVVEGADRIHVRLAGETEPRDAKLLAADPGNDLALIKIDGSGFPPATFAKPGNVQIGEPVVAIGSALDLDGDPSVTQGIVSAIDRTLVVDTQTEVLNGLVQTDAAISSGNSGGPLANASGEVIGINTAVARGDSVTAASNVGFAISSAELLRVLEQLRSQSAGAVREEGYMGVEVDERTDGGQGSVVSKVSPGSPAADAGIEPGDVVIAVDEGAIDGSAGLIAAVRDHEPGDTVKVTVLRDGAEKTLDVTLTTRPN